MGSEDSADPVRTAAESLVEFSSAAVEFGDADYLLGVRGCIRDLVALDGGPEGLDLVRIAVGCLRVLNRLLATGQYARKLQRDFRAAAGELAEVAGWLAFEDQRHDLAARLNRVSLSLSRSAGDKQIELLTLQNASLHVASRGHPREALEMAQSVIEGDYRLSPRVRGLFLTRAARARAQCGDSGAPGTFPEIRYLILDKARESDPAWTWWLNQHELAWHEAVSLLDLGLAGRAADGFADSAFLAPSGRPRSRYLLLAYLLQAHLRNRSWAAAKDTLGDVLSLSEQVEYPRAVMLLRDTVAQVRNSPALLPRGLRDEMSMLGSALALAEVLERWRERAERLAGIISWGSALT
jgi:hypothetical protein